MECCGFLFLRRWSEREGYCLFQLAISWWISMLGWKNTFWNSLIGAATLWKCEGGSSLGVVRNGVGVDFIMVDIIRSGLISCQSYSLVYALSIHTGPPYFSTNVKTKERNVGTQNSMKHHRTSGKLYSGKLYSGRLVLR